MFVGGLFHLGMHLICQSILFLYVLLRLVVWIVFRKCDYGLKVIHNLWKDETIHSIWFFEVVYVVLKVPLFVIEKNENDDADVDVDVDDVKSL